MKQTIITLLLLWPATVLFSQEVFRPGIVKGKNVTYHVSIAFIYHYNIKNVANDTTVKYGQKDHNWFIEQELERQLSEIFLKHLSPEELQLLKKTKDQIKICVRIDPENHNRLKQVTYFSVLNMYLVGLAYPELAIESYYGLWLNLDPDKLHEIEKDIVKQIWVPDGAYEAGLTGDFLLTLDWNQIDDPKRVKKESEKEKLQKWDEK